MAGYKVQLRDEDGNNQYPVTTTDIVVNAEGINVEDLLGRKQDKLISGQNIKTLNGQSLLGSGNIEIKGDVVYREIRRSDTDVTVEAILDYNKETLALAREMKVIPYFIADGVSVSFTSYSFENSPLSAHLEYLDAVQGTICTWDIASDGYPVIKTKDIKNRALPISSLEDRFVFINDFGYKVLNPRMPIGALNGGTSHGDIINASQSLITTVLYDRVGNVLHIIGHEASGITDCIYEVFDDGSLLAKGSANIGRFNIGGNELSIGEKEENSYNYYFLISKERAGVSIPFYLFDGNYNFYLIISYNWINSECTIIKNGAFETYKLTAEGLCYKI